MTKTIQNLAKAFVGESQARNRYTFYARIAQKEGFDKIAEVFSITAEQEREHAKWILRFINQLKKGNDGELEELIIEAKVPTTLGDTKTNLRSAIKGENYEQTTMYPNFASVAREEGFPKIAQRLQAIAVAERHHESRYKKILKEVENNTFFKKNKKVYWVCRKCGYIYEGSEPPEKCPSCGHPRGYFELQSEEY